MSILHTLDLVEQRLDTLMSIPEGERTDFVSGSIAQLSWCKEQIQQGIRSILPEDIEVDADDVAGEMYTKGTYGSPEDYTLNRPARTSASPCRPGRTHAYEFHVPQRNYKRCRYCEDVQRMIHGEKIAFGKRNKTPTPLAV